MRSREVNRRATNSKAMVEAFVECREEIEKVYRAFQEEQAMKGEPRKAGAGNE